MSHPTLNRRSVLATVPLAGAGALLLQPAYATTSSAETPFVDVPAHHPFATEIKWMYDSNISIGWAVGGGREYRPNMLLTREAMAAFLYRFAGSPAYTAPATSPFADVHPGHGFYKEISWMFDQGISTGWVSGRGREFRPSQTIQRDAMAAFLYRFTGSPEHSASTPSPFSDVAATSPFYNEIHWLYSSKISTGWAVSNRREFRPYAPVRRDAIAAFLYRLKSVQGSETPEPSPSETDEPAPSSYEEQVAREMLVLVNSERSKVGAGALKLNTAIQTVAQNWSKTMADQDRLYHNPNYTSLYPRGWRGAAENVAQNWRVNDPKAMAAALMNQWMNSPGHRANILNPQLTDFGSGISFTSSGKAYACQNFARY